MGGLIPVSITNYAVGLTFTASASPIAIAQFGSRGSDPKDSAILAQTLDQLLKKNQQLLEEIGLLWARCVAYLLLCVLSPSETTR